MTTQCTFKTEADQCGLLVGELRAARGIRAVRLAVEELEMWALHADDPAVRRRAADAICAAYPGATVQAEQSGALRIVYPPPRRMSADTRDLLAAAAKLAATKGLRMQVTFSARGFESFQVA